MKLNDFIEGLQILQKHYDNRDGYHLGAGNDIIYVYGTDVPLTEDDFIRLCELNWFQPEINSDDYADYNHEESWATYV